MEWKDKMPEPEGLKEETLVDDRGRIRERRHLRGGKLEGEYLSFFSNGQVMVRISFRQ